MRKLISMEGTIKTNDGREFTRLVGGFGDDRPVFTIWQLAELIGLKTKVLSQTFNRNINKFQNLVDYLDLKSEVTQSDHEINLKDFYTTNKLNRSNQWIIFSQAGLMKILKISNTDESWKLYEDFIEDYFKTKAELVVAENTMENNIKTLMDTKKMLLGSVILEQDEMKRLDIMQQIEKINNQIEENKITLTKEETVRQFEDIVILADKFTNSNKCYDIGLFSKLLDIPQMGRNNMFKWFRENKMLQDNNIPYQNMTDKFKVVYTQRNGQTYTKTLLKADGVKYVVKKLIKDGYIEGMSTEEILDKLKNLEEVA